MLESKGQKRLSIMPSDTIGERQPLLERVDEGSFRESSHWNLAGLSQKHFWVLVSWNDIVDLWT